MECYFSGNKKCGIWCTKYAGIWWKIVMVKRLRGSERWPPWCVSGNYELHVNRTQTQGEEQYVAFCAYCCEGDAEIHQGLLSVHSDAWRKVDESYGSISKLEKMACCERCTGFILSAYQREVKGSLMVKFTKRAWCLLCSTPGDPACSQQAAGKSRPCLLICFLFLVSSILSVLTKNTFLTPCSLAKQISL